MRPPLFWSRPRDARGVLPRLLIPLEMIWKSATRRRLANGPWEQLGVPVICVGNINIGGTGKTPSVIALLALFDDAGISAHVVSRGYGGSLEGPLQVDERNHSADEVGDEPLLISAFGPCWVAQDRALGAKEAIAEGAQVIVLDDGFQNPALAKDLSIVVVDAEVGFGNGQVIPAGPLRETVAEGLARADVVLSIGGKAAQAKLLADWPEVENLTHWKGELQALETGMDWQGRFIAFAGIGRPAKFFATLKALGADVVTTREFPDHAPYTDTVLQRLKAEAASKSAQLVTTEKDVARLPQHFKREVIALPVRLVFDRKDDVKNHLTSLVAKGVRVEKNKLS